MITDWTDAYEVGKYIKNAATYPPIWAQSAADYRAQLGPRARLDIPYGEDDRQRFDLFLPDAAPKGLAVFVHGGYWKAFDKSSWSHLGAGANARGWAVCMPSYRLAPEARISEIAREISTAICAAAELVGGPIRLAGHSAGGHLVSRMACRDVDFAVADRLQHVLSISGLHDMRPLLKTEMNAVLGLTTEEATAESAALCLPRPGVVLTTWVGSNERPEFLRQSDLLANIWTGCGIKTRTHLDDGKHHFNVIDGLDNAMSPITQAFIGTLAEAV